MNILQKPSDMPQAQFDSMVKRNGITAEKIEAAKAAVERGRKLIEESKKRLGK